MTDYVVRSGGLLRFTDGTPVDAGMIRYLTGTLADIDTIYVPKADVLVNAADYTGWDTGNRTAALQAAVDALPDDQGGLVMIPSDVVLTTAINVSTAGVGFVGRGSTGQGVSLAWGATRIYGPASGYAFNCNNSQANYAGPLFRDLMIVGNATGAGGIRLTGQSNFRIGGVTVTGYTAGIGVLAERGGYNSQYGTLSDVQLTDCLTALKIDGSNGLRFIGGMVDANHNNGSIRASSTGIYLISGDTLRCFGTVFQYTATAVDLAVGLNPELHGCRFEGFTTAVKTAAPDTRVEGGSFNNSILGGGGTAFDVQAAATNTFLDPGSVVSVTTLLTDAGTRTHWGKVERLTFGAGELAAVASGANPTLTDIPDGRTPAWDLTDGAAKGAMASMVSIPAHWITFSVTVLWVSVAAAPAGNVRWRLDYTFLATGSNVSTDHTAGAHTSVAQPAQNILTATNLGNITNVPGELCNVEPLRRGDDGANDTCTDTVYLLGIQLDRVT